MGAMNASADRVDRDSELERCPPPARLPRLAGGARLSRRSVGGDRRRQRLRRRVALADRVGVSRVRVLRDENLGFAAACNEGADAQRRVVAFLNNDVRVDPGWVRALVAPLRPAAGTSSAGRMLDWEGTHRLRRRLGELSRSRLPGPLPRPDERLIEDGSDLLFACGGSMVVRRDVFQDPGGFDSSTSPSSRTSTWAGACGSRARRASPAVAYTATTPPPRPPAPSARILSTSATRCTRSSRTWTTTISRRSSLRPSSCS